MMILLGSQRVANNIIKIRRAYEDCSHDNDTTKHLDFTQLIHRVAALLDVEGLPITPYGTSSFSRFREDRRRYCEAQQLDITKVR